MDLTNAQINEILVEYPEKISVAEKEWKIARLERERVESLTYFSLKAKHAEEKMTERLLENYVRSDESVHRAKLDEIVKESEYNKLYETLMCVKKMASLRAAF